MQARALLLFCALAPAAIVVGCSEYDLKATTDADGTDSDEPGPAGPGGPGPQISACDAAADPGVGSVPLNDECEVDLQTGSFTPIVEWSYGSSSFCGPAGVAQILDTNGSGGIDSDDIPAVVMFQNNSVIALYGDGSGVAWQAIGNYGQDGGFAMGDVDGDEWPDVVTASESKVCALNGMTGVEIWCTSGLNSSLDAYGFNYPALADMNGDGIVEVTAGDAILHGPTGALLGRGGLGIGAAKYSDQNVYYGAISVPVDLDNDGQMELVTGNAAYTVDGALKWSNGGLDGLVAVADFDGDGEGEIVKTTNGTIIGMETDGTEVWGPVSFVPGAGGYAALGTPAIDDLDGDGDPEIVFAARDELIAMEWGGTIMWRAAISDTSGAAGPVLFDFEMDGYPEVLYADEESIRFFSGLDGAVKYYSTEHDSYTILETPIVADVDGDDQVEIVLGHCGGAGFGGGTQGLTVFGDADESWPAGRKVWNQHAYYITNIDDLGSVPGPTPNWELYNSFRSGDIGRPPSEFWDLRAEILDVCEDECDEGKVYVAARVNNAGNIEAPAGVVMSLRAGAGGEILTSAVTTAAIEPGVTGEMLVFEASADFLGGYAPVVTADEDTRGNSFFYECDENNNVDAWLSPVCE